MKSYVIDDLRFHDYQKIKAYADKHFDIAGVNGIYWIPLEPDVLSEVQAAHKHCQPFYFAVDLKFKQIACELLVRTQNSIRCDCMAYATEHQRNWLIRFIDELFDELEIKT